MSYPKLEEELGACCLDDRASTSASEFGTTTMQNGMIRPELDFFNQIGKNSTEFNELEELLNTLEQLPNDLVDDINVLKAECTVPAATKNSAKNTFENQTIDFLYGSVIRDAEIALKEVESQPGTTKSNKMIEYYSKHCQFILALAKQEKASCIDDTTGVCNDETRLKELERAEDCLDKLAKSFVEIQNTGKK